jgi:hypothetical protein
MKLTNIMPWGRSFEEYRGMFALSDEDLQGRLLGCGDGPASFNAEATLAGARVVSVDPIYAFAASEIEGRVAEIYETVMSQTRAQAHRFVWDYFADVDALGHARLSAMRRFLLDYETGKKAGRYIKASLPALPFTDERFDLALCSHLLFLYSEHLSLDEHIAATSELLRVAHEVRIFPLLSVSAKTEARTTTSAVATALARRGSHSTAGMDTILRLPEERGGPSTGLGSRGWIEMAEICSEHRAPSNLTPARNAPPPRASPARSCSPTHSQQ